MVVTSRAGWVKECGAIFVLALCWIWEELKWALWVKRKKAER